MSVSSSGDNIKGGIAAIVLSTVLFSFLWCLVKNMSERYSVYEVTFFRNVCALVPMFGMVEARRQWRQLRVEKISRHVWRAVIGVSSMVLGFLSYHLMPLANAVAISFMAPLLITALSVPLLGERVGVFRWSAVIIGFGGVLIVVQPGGEPVSLGVLVAVGAAITNALAMITIRQLNRSDAPFTIVFYFTLFSTLFTAVPLPFLWTTPTGWEDWGLMILMGLAGGAGQYYMTKAFSLAPVSVISPFTYASLLWSILFGWFFWSDIPKLHVFIGSVIVIASGIFIIYRETREKASPAQPL